MSIHSGRELTNAIISALTTAGLVVGDGIKPTSNAGWQGAPASANFNPYVIVYATPGGFYDGPVGDSFADARVDYTISAFGASQDQAQWGADKVFATLTNPANVTVSGRSVQLISPDVDGGCIRDDDVTPPVFHSPTRWRAMTTG
jgi:hypothetical protein